MSIAFEVSDVLPAPPDEIYAAWLDSESHSEMTGAPARAGDRVGDEFEAWEGYISGRNLELEPGRRILQAWRTEEFDPSDPDSRLEILLEPSGQGTKITIKHSELPPHGRQYEQGWVENYFEPMKEYFGEIE